MSKILKKSQLLARKEFRDAGFTKKFKFKPKDGKHIFTGVDKVTGTKVKAIYSYDDKGYYYKSTEYISWKGEYSSNEDIIIKARYDGPGGIFKVEKAENKKRYRELISDAIGSNGLYDSSDAQQLAYALDLFPGVAPNDPYSIGVQIGDSGMQWA